MAVEAGLFVLPARLPCLPACLVCLPAMFVPATSALDLLMML